MPPKTSGGSHGERSAYAGVVIGAESGTPVAAQRIWMEHVEKELRFQVVREEYTRNPATVLLLPEKPCDPRRALALRTDAEAEKERTERIMKLREQDPKAHDDTVGRLERADKEPRAKYAFPMTSSQEIGWDLEHASRHAAESSQSSHPHTNGDITLFADRYVRNCGYNPHSTKQFKFLSKQGSGKK